MGGWRQIGTWPLGPVVAAGGIAVALRVGLATTRIVGWCRRSGFIGALPQATSTGREPDLNTLILTTDRRSIDVPLAVVIDRAGVELGTT